MSLADKQTWRLAALAMALLFAAAAAATAGQAAAEGPVYVLTAKGAVTPVMAGYIDRGLREAEEGGAHLAVIQLDTPGGLDTAMRDIVQRINGARVPVVVYVSPAGARAASAGAFITMAAHVAVMAPNTAIGAAHPVAGSGEEIKGPMADKVTNDAVAYIRGIAELRGRNKEWAEKAVRESISASADAAVEQQVVDLVASDLNDLLSKVDGRAVKIISGETTLQTGSAPLHHIEVNPIESFLGAIADPNIAYLLLSLAMLAIFLELSNPGAMLPGIVGGVCLLLALFALGMLPVNIAGLLLIGLGFLLFLAEIWVASHGILGIGGAISLLLGSLILMSGAPVGLQINPWLIASVVGFFTVLFVLIARALLGTWRHSQGPERGSVRVEVGAVGTARTDIDGGGTVLLHGELWSARSSARQIAAGDRVIVTAVHGLELEVSPTMAAATSPPPPKG